MNAIQWLRKELECDEKSPLNILFENYEPYMEKYAKYKVREMESKILQFRNILKEKAKHDCIQDGIIITLENTKAWLNEFDEHFNIETKTKGEI